MAANPDESRRRQEEALAALLLLGSSYSLPQLIRNAKVRPRPFRRIEATETLRASIATPYFDLVRAWQEERAALLDAYSLALPARGEPVSPDAAAQIRRAVDDAGARVQRKLDVLERQFPSRFQRLAEWHRLQWGQRIRAATRLDVMLLSSPNTTRPEVETAVAWNQHLAGQVHDDIKGAVTTALLGAIAIRAASTPREGRSEEASRQRAIRREAKAAPGSPTSEPDGGEAPSAAEMLDDLLAKAKKRVARIAVDQTEKASADMDRARRREAGLARFRWHHTHQLHPRPEHRRRDGRVYSQATAPNDRAGTLPFCKCWEEPLFD